MDASVASALETWRSATDPATGKDVLLQPRHQGNQVGSSPELVDAYRSVVAKKAAMAAAVGGTAAVGAVATTQEKREQGGKATNGAAVAAAESAAAATNQDHQDLKKGASIRKMLGIKKKGKGAVKKGRTGKKDAMAADIEAAGADQGMNGTAAAAAGMNEEEMSDDEKSDLVAKEVDGNGIPIDIAGAKSASL